MTEAAAQADDELEACFKVVEARCREAGIVVSRLPEAAPGSLGLELHGASRIWKLDVACGWPRYTHLPLVRLRENHELLAHVLYRGGVCVDDAQGLSMDLDARDQVVAYTVVKAWKLLEDSAVDADGDRSEFFNELGAYWGTLPDCLLARSAVEGRGSRRLVAQRLGQGKDATWYFVERDIPPPPEFRLKNAVAHRGALFELPAPLLPPAPGAPLDAEYVRKALESLDAHQQLVWKDLAGPSMNGPREVAILLSMPRSDGTQTHIGLSLHISKGVPDPKKPVYPLDVVRHTTGYMRERGGASESLQDKHVVIFGCGSVGSELADALASSGVGKLTLVDEDVMSPDNVFRHLLGRSSVGFSKVVSCKVELESHYPELQVNAVRKAAEDWLTATSLEGVHAIAMAVGLPTLERVLAQTVRAAGVTIPLLTTWLEPLDLGGHSVVVSGQGVGCLDCLYRDDEGAPSLSSRTAFLAPNQKVSRNLTGCASVYVPYGALQSRRTALMAAEHLLDALDAGPVPSYRFWTGPGKQARAQGLASTNWWSGSRTTSHEDATRMVFGEPCPKCRTGSAP